MEALYTIHVPKTGVDGEDLSWILANARRSLSNAGIQGRVVFRDLEGDWGDDSRESMDIIQIVASDEPRSDATIHTIALGIKELSRKDAVYVTKVPGVQSWLVTGPGMRPEPPKKT